MNKPLLGIIALVVLIGLGAGGALLLNNSSMNNSTDTNQTDTQQQPSTDTTTPESTASNNSDQNTEEAANENDNTESTEAGTYADYTAARLSAASGDQIVIFFHASWCPSCRQQDDNLVSDREDIPAGVTILKADYDSETNLKQKYGVTLQHTFVQVDSEGNQLKMWNSFYADYSLQGILDQLV